MDWIRLIGIEMLSICLNKPPIVWDQIMIPKVGCAGDLYAVDALVSAIEAAKGRGKRIAFEVIIESAAGIAHVEEIAAASPRLQAMSLGAADFAASMGMQTTGIGGTQENYYMLQSGQKALVRPMALGTNRYCSSMSHTWCFACRRPLWRFFRRRRLSRSVPQVRDTGNGRQMGDSSKADRFGQ